MKMAGRVEYGGRAFGQDAMAAMRGDIVRALVELITNADDAYGDGQDLIEIVVRPATSNDGVDPSRMPWAVEVHDRAKGLDADGLKRCFAVLGGTNEAFQGGQQVRGLFGRGAKDVAALGHVRFEAVRNGRYNRLDLTNVGEWALHGPLDAIPDEGTLESLGLSAGEAGLTATVFVAQPTKVPRRTTLMERLSDHAQLRNLLRRREVLLTDLRDSQQAIVLEPRDNRGEVIIDCSLSVGSYGDVSLSVRRLPARVTQPLTDHSEHGILISGRNATYENTLFAFNGRPESGWLAGEVVSPQIEDLVRAFDGEGATATNPQRLVARDRDGLVREHPFFVELQRQCSLKLLPELERLATDGARARRPGEKLNRAFAAAQQALSMQMREMLREIDDAEPIGPRPAPGRTPAIAVIPPKLVLHPGEERTLTVRLAGTSPPAFETEIVRCSPAGLVEITQSGDVPRRHPRLDAFNSSVRVRAGTELGEAQLRARAGQSVAYAELLVVEPADANTTEITALEFERQHYSLGPERARNLLLRAPLADLDTPVQIIADPSKVSFPDQLTMQPSSDGRRAEAIVRIEAHKSLGKASITAIAEDGREAACTVDIVERAPAQGLDLSVELRPQSHPVRRATAEYLEGRVSVIVYGGHVTLKRLLGPYDDKEGRYRGEDDAASRAVLAEIIGLELANLLVEREVLRRPEFDWDAARVLNRQRERAGRLVAIAQGALEER